MGGMTIWELLLLLLIAAVCGSIGMKIAGLHRAGCLASIAVGFIGALLGNRLAGWLDLPLVLPINVGGQSFPLVWSIAGGALFAAVIVLLTGRRRRY